MFCRYCGAGIAADSVFCSRCGKRLAESRYPRWERAVAILRLKTPYPYAVMLFALFLAWTIGAPRERFDYSGIVWTLEVERSAETPADNSYSQRLGLTVENTGAEPVSRIPVEIRASITPAQPADTIAGFLGRELWIMQAGEPLPLTVVLSDTIAPGARMHYSIDGVIQAQSPFTVTYEIRTEDGSGTVLASAIVER